MGDLSPEFRKAVDVPAFEQAQAQYGATDPETQAIRKVERDATRDEQTLDYNISTMDEAERAAMGRVGNQVTASAQAEEVNKNARERQKNNTDLQVQLAAMRLGEFEGGLVEQYGENFDLNLIGDLVEDGHFTQEEYERFASIEDPEERRRAIAKAIQDKIDAGELDPADLADHPWAMEWLKKHEEARAEQSLEADMGLSGQKAIADVSIGGQEVIGDSTTRQSDIDEVDRVAENNMTDVAASSGFSLNLG